MQALLSFTRGSLAEIMNEWGQVLHHLIAGEVFIYDPFNCPNSNVTPNIDKK